jgi:osmoprotectant transport system ATP-binding protein
VTSSAAVVTLEHVSKRYGPAGSPEAVSDLSLEIPAGEICVLVGPSGCGKTTTMKMINRLIEPTSGRITIDGEDVMALPAVELRRRIGYVIQQVGLFPHLTVAENVAVVPRLLRWPDARVKERTEELLDLVRLAPATYRDRYPTALSGGERQRVGVARALAADPPLMLMDEPFGAVDPILRDRLQNELLRLQAVVRKTIVFVTHDVDEAIKMADRIAILRRGGILAQYDRPDAILAAPASEFVEHFVGADRGLKRLSLGRVRDLPLAQPITARSGESHADLRGRLEAAGADHALLLDGDDRPIGWIGKRDLGRDGHVVAEDATPGSPLLQPESTLRDALSAMLGSSVQLGVVVDEGDRMIGVISVDAISDVMRAPVARPA